MALCRRLIVVGIIIAQMCGGCLARATFKLQILRFTNAPGEDWDGNTCDSGPSGWFGKHKCDHMFTFCLDDKAGNDDANSCAYRQLTTGHMDDYDNDHDITFDNDNGGNHYLVVTFDSWPGAVLFKVEVMDHDSFTDHDDVDLFRNVLSGSPQRGATVWPTWSRQTLFGRRTRADPTELYIQTQLYCDSNYYTDACTVYCAERDEDRRGHYTCHPVDGHKVCRRGWEGADCTTAVDYCREHKCQHNSTCVSGDGTYSCDCLQGYTGDRCSVNVNDCVNVTCHHGGTCVDERDSYRCACASPYSGAHCDSHPCDVTTPCRNGGTCVATRNESVTCECPEAYEGKFCERMITTTTTTTPRTPTTTTTWTETTTTTMKTTTGIPAEASQLRNDEMSTADRSAMPLWAIVLTILIILAIIVVVVVAAIITSRRRQRRKSPPASVDQSNFTNPIYSVQSDAQCGTQTDAAAQPNAHAGTHADALAGTHAHASTGMHAHASTQVDMQAAGGAPEAVAVAVLPPPYCRVDSTPAAVYFSKASAENAENEVKEPAIVAEARGRYDYPVGPPPAPVYDRLPARPGRVDDRPPARPALSRQADAGADQAPPLPPKNFKS